jgi:hypothetical protein
VYFDIGVFHTREPWIRERMVLKLAGYKLGVLEKKMPEALKKRLSMHYRYWQSG